MPFLETRVSGKFSERLKQRSSAWGGAQVSRKLVVHPELSFWYWQEFGTGTRREPTPGQPFDIRPVNKKVLAYPGEGGFVFTSEVLNHPGIPPTYSVRDSLDPIKDRLRELVADAMKSGGADNPALVGKALEGALEFGLQEIVSRMADRIPGTRPPEDKYEGGRLKGESAASAFQRGARVVGGKES